MTSLFISYRRDDSQGFADRLADELADALGPDRVFSDVEIPVGSDFGEVLHRAVAASDGLLVVIGKRWAAESSKGYPSRLFEPDDWVRTEIEAAFQQGRRVVPVLVGGAQVPLSESLPVGLRPLLRLQAAELSVRHWDDDVAALLQRMRALWPGLDDGRAATATPPPLARVLQEVAERVLREPGRHPPPPAVPAAATGLMQRSLLAIGRAMGRGLRRLAAILLALGVLYGGVRLFGDAPTLRLLDRAEARMIVGWDRLLQRIGGR